MSDHFIHVLDKDTINKIAAGEVVERPASVVKELIDNSIDAGAKNIRIELKNSGKTLISIQDDGIGMSREDVALSPIKHATSKIKNISDLESVSTMGFRGEALAAISSVSNFEIITKRKADSTGTRLYFENGKQKITDYGAPDGTAVHVENLFFNTPARLKYMKSDATELSHIAAIVSDLILANPSVSFTLTNNGKTVISSASSDLFNSIVDVLGHEAARMMMEIPSAESSETSENIKKAADEISAMAEFADIQIKGYISKPTYNRSSPDSLFFIINNRPVSSKELIKAVRLGYYTKLPKDRYPAAVIHLQIDPKEVDVNVHPRKIEVRFRDENKLIKIVSAVIETTLRCNELAPQFSASDAKKIVEKSFSDFGLQNTAKKKSDSIPESNSASSSGSASNSSSASTLASNSLIRETSADYSTQTSSDPDNTQKPIGRSASAFDESFSPFSSPASSKKESGYVAPAKDTEKRLKATERMLAGNAGSKNTHASSEISILDDLRIVGQISNLYLLAEKDGGLLIIDQHAAHERIFYDLNKKKNNTSVQELISPAIVNLSAKEKVIIDEYIPYLEEIGFGISEFGDYSYAVSFIPIVFGKLEDASVIHDFIDDLLSFGKIKDEIGRRDTVAKRTACRAAIKAGACCNQQQIEELINQLKQTENPYSCPHGRPTILIFSKKEIEKLFERS